MLAHMTLRDEGGMTDVRVYTMLRDCLPTGFAFASPSEVYRPIL